MRQLYLSVYLPACKTIIRLVVLDRPGQPNAQSQPLRALARLNSTLHELYPQSGYSSILPLSIKPAEQAENNRHLRCLPSKAPTFPNLFPGR
ncbi:MAG: hypothetical protein N3E45_01645 [Oscillatoriaceae bacterium SKW80]|nr:hypothetical protein [Oscillatoriaceae bacterium SKYG93]MCX8119532.1 hypothetical protein [Oscillatoriaceae bacterium SKW80]MDW8454999.1 hypothetical protein [Oscillatoriaceae cyanobacterium SKYGB_i_bin93]HIK28225.1 hypothetical protein [Oscillatoriaceae cyanobacterium M7585_C2015_266]